MRRFGATLIAALIVALSPTPDLHAQAKDNVDVFLRRIEQIRTAVCGYQRQPVFFDQRRHTAARFHALDLETEQLETVESKTAHFRKNLLDPGRISAFPDDD